MIKAYKELAEIKAQQKILSEKESDLKEKIVKDLKKKGIDGDTTEFGKFKISQRSYWQYTDNLKAEVAKMQKKEQATGKAEQKVTESLTFTPSKND